MKTTALSFISAVVIASNSGCVETGNSASYVALPIAGARFQSTLHLKDGFLYEGDIGSPIKYCDAGDDLYCFISDRIVFAVPKDGIAIGDTWSLQEFRMHATASAVFAAMDWLVPVVIIESESSRVAYRFLYSKAHGVVAYEVAPNRDWSESRLMMLHGACGIGCQWSPSMPELAEAR